MKDAIIKTFEESAQVKVKFARENADKIVEVVQLIAQAFREGKKVLLSSAMAEAPPTPRISPPSS